MHKVAFVDLSRNFWDKHPVYCLSAYLKKNGIAVHYINENRVKEAIDEIKTLQPDMLLYSAFSVHVSTYVEFDRIVKEHIKLKSIMGGPGPTFDWNISRGSTIDAFCVGEGEYALAEYITNGSQGVRNIILNGEGSPNGYFDFADLDTLPFPDRDLVYERDSLVRDLSTKWFISGRGCPYKCTYCFNHQFNEMFKSCGTIVRKKSVGYLIEEILDVKNKYPFKNIMFNDDTFILNKKWFFEFAERYPDKVGLPYACNIRPDLADRAVIEALKESGCVAAMWSIETADDAISSNVLKRNVTKDQILECGRLLNESKIPFRVGNMIGLPGETWEQMLETLRLNIDVKSTLSNATIFCPYPNLKLTEYAIANKYLSRDAMGSLPKNLFTGTMLNFTPEEKIKIQKLTYLFPILAKIPFLFNNKWLFNLVFCLPRFVLLNIYEIFNLFMQRKVYNAKTSLLITVRMIGRYIYNRQMS